MSVNRQVPHNFKLEGAKPRNAQLRKSLSLSVGIAGLFLAMMNITFKLEIFGGRNARVGEDFKVSRKSSEKALLWLLESLVNINRLELRQNKLPPLYRSGVRYLREPRGQENWQDCITTLKRGLGDCEDLACWRIAELRNNGKKASPYIRYRYEPDTGIYIYHVLVLRASGLLEDPSRKLGMK